MFGDFSALSKAGDEMAAKFAQVVALLDTLAKEQARTNALLEQLVTEKNDGR